MTIGTLKTQTSKQEMPKQLSGNFEASVPSLLYASLPSACVKLFCIVKQLQHPKTLFCTATNETLGHYVNASAKTVKKYLKLLREAGFLSVRLEVKGDGSERKFYRFLRVSNYRIDTCREIVKDWDDKGNTKQIEDFENDENADCEEQNEARDADTGEEVVSFEAEKGVQQGELIPVETAVAESPMEIFERTLWKHPETCEYIKQGGSVKAKAFQRWCKVTKDGKLTEVCDLLRTQYRKMVEGRKRQGTNWNALEVFLNPVMEKWKTDWDSLGAHTSAFANTAPRGVTVLNRTTTRTAAQVTTSTATGVADAKVATETVSETATVLGGDNLHLRDDYQKGSLPRDWVTIAVEKKLSELNLSKGIIDSWRKITNWKFCPKELKQAVASLYDEGFRFDPRYDKVVTAGHEEDFAQRIAEHAAFLAHDENLDWLIYEKAKKYFDADNNLVFDTDLLIHVFKPAEECVEFVSFDDFDGEGWLKKNAARLVKNDVNLTKRLLGKIKQLSLACNSSAPIRTLPTEQKPKSIQPIGSIVKNLTAETQSTPEEPKEFELDENYEAKTKPRFWLKFVSKFMSWKFTEAEINCIETADTWGKFLPFMFLDALKQAFKLATRSEKLNEHYRSLGQSNPFWRKDLYKIAEECNVGV